MALRAVVPATVLVKGDGASSSITVDLREAGRAVDPPLKTPPTEIVLTPANPAQPVAITATHHFSVTLAFNTTPADGQIVGVDLWLLF